MMYMHLNASKQPHRGGLFSGVTWLDLYLDVPIRIAEGDGGTVSQKERPKDHGVKKKTPG